MNIDWWTLGLQAVNALVLVWLLSRFLFRPVADILTARQKAAEQAIADAQAAKAAAEDARAKAEAEAAGLAERRREALKAVEAEAANVKAALLTEARAEAEKLHAAAITEIAAERRAQEAAAADRAGQLAVDIAAKLFNRLPSGSRVDGFIKGIATGLSALPDATRAALAATDAPIHLTAAQALTAEESEACRTALAGVLGRPIAIDVNVDPTLIAGLELEGPDAVVRNSFRADLVRLKTELNSHDRNLT
jgi:F-type H+-transporting ATPase subunit b